MRRRGLLVLVAVSFALSLGGLVALAKRSTTPPGKPIVIKACAKKKPPVKFDHPKHVKYMKDHKQNCEVCHHKVKNKPAEHDRCSKCHMKKMNDKLSTCQDKSKKTNPFHIQCIGCHKKMKAKAPKAPTKCKGCHKK